MALTLDERLVVRLMIRSGISDATIDAISSDDATARAEIAAFKADKLPKVIYAISRQTNLINGIQDNINLETVIKNRLEAV